MPAIEQDIAIPFPTVEPYNASRFDECRACGIVISRWDKLLSAFKGSLASTQNVQFCGGGKSPTATHEERGVVDQVLFGRAHLNPCAGILEPHLHLTCRRCSYLVLVATKNIVQRAV